MPKPLRRHHSIAPLGCRIFEEEEDFNMKKKVIVGLLVLMTLCLLVPSAFAKGHTIGVVIPYEIGWFAGFHNGFQIVANNQGDKLVFAYHNY